MKKNEDGTVTVRGYLARDREIRYTRETTRSVRHFNPVAECFDESEYTPRSREYCVLRLATHHWERGRRVTTYHWLRVNDFEQMHWFHVRHARSGDEVEITGTPDSFMIIDESGRRSPFRQILVEEFHYIEKKAARLRRKGR